MLKVYCEGLDTFEAWSGARAFWEELQERGLVQDFENLLEECYPDGVRDSQVNDLLWFEEDWIRECLGISEDEEEG